MITKEKYDELVSGLKQHGATLVAVSKLQFPEKIKTLYDFGHRHFGENYVQELLEKKEMFPADIQWHFIGHLQSNKVKYIAPFIHLIHGVDTEKLLKEINKQAAKAGRQIAVLLQVFIADEETKFGMDEGEVEAVMQNKSAYPHVCIKGLMGMASFSEDMDKVGREFEGLKRLYDKYPEFEILSMGMSADYQTALTHGSNMVRIGSLVFGHRQ